MLKQRDILSQFTFYMPFGNISRFPQKPDHSGELKGDRKEKVGVVTEKTEKRKKKFASIDSISIEIDVDIS